MIPSMLSWRSMTRDRIFVVLFITAVLTFLICVAERKPSLEHSPIGFELTVSFLIINLLFAVLSQRREPLLAYMFLTATILLNGILFFFFHYLILIQAT